MLKFLSKVVVEYNPLDPRKAAAVELLAQCNGRKAKDSNPACSVELRRLLETEQLFREAGEKWPVVIPEEELGMSFPGIKPKKAEEKPQAS